MADPRTIEKSLSDTAEYPCTGRHMVIACQSGNSSAADSMSCCGWENVIRWSWRSENARARIGPEGFSSKLFLCHSISTLYPDRRCEVTALTSPWKRDSDTNMMHATRTASLCELLVVYASPFASRCRRETRALVHCAWVNVVLFSILSFDLKAFASVMNFQCKELIAMAACRTAGSSSATRWTSRCQKSSTIEPVHFLEVCPLNRSRNCRSAGERPTWLGSSNLRAMTRGVVVGMVFGAGAMIRMSRMSRVRQSGVLTYSHTCFVLMHRRHEGWVSSHFLRRTLASDWVSCRGTR